MLVFMSICTNGLWNRSRGNCRDVMWRWGSRLVRRDRKTYFMNSRNSDFISEVDDVHQPSATELILRFWNLRRRNIRHWEGNVRLQETVDLPPTTPECMLTVGSGPWKQRWAPHVMLYIVRESTGDFTFLPPIGTTNELIDEATRSQSLVYFAVYHVNL